MKNKFPYCFLLFIVLFSCKKDQYFDGVGIPIREINRGDYGIVGLNGEILVDFELDAKPTIMVENWAHYTFDKQLIFVNNKGQETKTDFQDALLFNEGHVLVRQNNGKLAFLDKNLKKVITLDGVESASSLSNGVFKFLNTDGYWGFMDIKGNEIIRPVYNNVKSFREGLAIVKKKDEELEDDQIGVIDKFGKTKIPLTTKYEKLDFFSEGLCAFKEDDQFGYLNTEGKKVIISDNWKELFPFFNGLATVEGQDGEYGLIDKKGKYLIKTRESLPIKLFNDLTIYQGNNRKLGFMSSSREEVTRSEFEDIMPYLNNGAFAKDGGEWMYVDEKGNDISSYKNTIRLLYHEPFTKAVYRYNTAFDLDKTLNSTYIDINGFYANILNLSNGILGKLTVGENIDVGVLERFCLDYEKDFSVIDDTPIRATRIDTYTLFNEYFKYDNSILFSMRFYFNKPVVHISKGERALNENTEYTSIKVKAKLQNKGRGRAKEMLEKIKMLFSKQYELGDKNRFIAGEKTRIKLSYEYANIYITYEFID